MPSADAPAAAPTAPGEVEAEVDQAQKEREAAELEERRKATRERREELRSRLSPEAQKTFDDLLEKGLSDREKGMISLFMGVTSLSIFMLSCLAVLAFAPGLPGLIYNVVSDFFTHNKINLGHFESFIENTFPSVPIAQNQGAKIVK